MAPPWYFSAPVHICGNALQLDDWIASRIPPDHDDDHNYADDEYEHEYEYGYKHDD